MRPDILLISGQYFDLTHPEASEFTINDVAHALAHICRYAGHVRRFYSVAQHSVYVSYVVPPRIALAGLLHDAAEAFIGDVTAPLKSLLPDYKAIEKQVEAAVLAQFGLPPDLPPEVKIADLTLLYMEQRDLMPPHDDLWAVELMPEIQPPPWQILPVGPDVAKISFLTRFHEIINRKPTTANRSPE